MPTPIAKLSSKPSQIDLRNVVEVLRLTTLRNHHSYGLELEIQYDNNWPITMTMLVGRYVTLKKLLDITGTCGAMTSTERKQYRILTVAFQGVDPK